MNPDIFKSYMELTPGEVSFANNCPFGKKVSENGVRFGSAL